MHKKRLSPPVIAAMLSILLILAIPGACAISMKLLAVSKSSTGLIGTDADLDLEIKPGSGRVFISTFPLTSVDTQVSFRMAKEYACDFLERDCSGYDFFYVINSGAPIIGGPSAGGPATALTIIALDNLKLDKTVAATGTINSGGIIGPVAGIKQKIDAASRVGIKKVLIPEGTRYAEIDEMPVSAQLKLNFSNITIDLVEYGDSKGVEVVEAADIGDLVYGLTGKRYPEIEGDVEISPIYSQIMSNISDDLCRRGTELLDSIKPTTDEDLQWQLDSAENLTIQAAVSREMGYYYSAASFCYGANVKYRYISLAQANLSVKELGMLINSTRVEKEGLDKQLSDYKYSTINDLQTYLVVSERLSEAEDYLDDGAELLNKSDLSDSTYSLSLAIERVYSAYYWSQFFGQGGREFDIDEATLATFCLNKVSEADERIQYIKSLVPISLESLQAELNQANADYSAGRYEECIFTASKTNARSNLVMSAIGMQEKDLERVLNHKITKAKETIIKETRRDVFPLLGYSYYEYAQNLKTTDKSSALLYTELSLELSSFDLYLEEVGSRRFHLSLLPNYMYFFAGIIVGYTIAILLVWALKAAKSGKKRKIKRTPAHPAQLKSSVHHLQRRK